MDENTQALYNQYMSDIQSMTQANNNWSAEQAQIAREWDYFMSSTAHEREVADLRRAGLNPVLSAGGSGATTGSAAQATSQGNGLTAMASLMSKMLDASIEQSRASYGAGSALALLAEKDLMDKNGELYDSVKGESLGSLSPADAWKDPILQRNEVDYLRSINALQAYDKEIGNILDIPRGGRTPFSKNKAPEGGAVNHFDPTVRRISEEQAMQAYRDYAEEVFKPVSGEQIMNFLPNLINSFAGRRIVKGFSNNFPIVHGALGMVSQALADAWNHLFVYHSGRSRRELQDQYWEHH